MQFFVAENSLLYKATAPDALVDRVPGFRTSMEAAADLRTQYRQSGDEGRLGGGEWRHVATISAPVEAMVNILNPDGRFLNRNGKKDFYKWLDANKAYCAYDRRRAAKRSDMVTFVDGKEV